MSQRILRDRKVEEEASGSRMLMGFNSVHFRGGPRGWRVAGETLFVTTVCVGGCCMLLLDEKGKGRG